MMGSVRSFVDLLTCLTGLSSFGIFFTGLVVDSTLFIGTRLRPLVTGSRDMLIDSSCAAVEGFRLRGSSYLLRLTALGSFVLNPFI